MRWKRSGRVLVIDDEEPVRMMVVAMLRHFGLTPVDAADGESGLALFRAEPKSFDLVMLDLLMPGMTGEQTLAALRAIEPEVRVLLVSGYSRGDILGRLAGPGRLGFLSKPFGRESMERSLREIFEG